MLVPELQQFRGLIGLPVFRVGDSSTTINIPWLEKVSLNLISAEGVELLHYALIVPILPIKDQRYKIVTNFPACGDDVFGRDGRPLDQLADELEADASRGSCDEDTTCEHSGFCNLESFFSF